MSAYLIGSRWHLRHARGSDTICGKPIPPPPYAPKIRHVETVPKSRWCKTCLGVVGLIVSLGEAHRELAEKRKETP